MLFVRPLTSLLISATIGFVGNAALTIFLRAKMPGHTKPTVQWYDGATLEQLEQRHKQVQGGGGRAGRLCRVWWGRIARR